MKKQRSYCSYCGGKITGKIQDGKSRDYCPGCNTFFYENPLPVASTMVVNDNREVLLVRRKKDPVPRYVVSPDRFCGIRRRNNRKRRSGNSERKRALPVRLSGSLMLIRLIIIFTAALPSLPMKCAGLAGPYNRVMMHLMHNTSR